MLLVLKRGGQAAFDRALPTRRETIHGALIFYNTMRLKSFSLKNFRGYKNEVRFELSDLTVLVGRNDIGKSTILEALDIFFNDKAAVCPLESADVNKKAWEDGDKETVFTAVFDQLPDSIIIDESVPTSLQKEMLLDCSGCLTVVKRYQDAGKQKVYIKANHPTNPECNDLLLKKISDLKNKAKDLDCEDRTKKSLLRRTIWDHFSGDLQLAEGEIDTSGDGLKDIWQKLERYMPIYSLFQSDRSNSDKDKEAQDPLKEAVKEIFSNQEILDKLTEVAEEVKAKLQSVTSATLAKISEMNPEIAQTLSPSIPSVESLKWADVFKNVSITSDNEIEINKRGSGVKRLILLNFFRAKAERMMHESNHTNVIYAIEEPETSQHIHHQRMLIEAFKGISSNPNAQILMTTHSSHVVKMLSFDNLRLIEEISGAKNIRAVEQSCLPIPSLNEINYSAFGEYSGEYHDELYGFLQTKAIDENDENGKEESFDNWLVSKGCVKTKTWQKKKNNGNVSSRSSTIQQYIRNKIHHPENQLNAPYSFEELKTSIDKMREIVISLT